MKTRSISVSCVLCLAAASLVMPVNAGADTLSDPSTALGLFNVVGELRKDFNNFRFDVEAGRVRIRNTTNGEYFFFTASGFQFYRAGATYFDNMKGAGSTRFRVSTTDGARDVLTLVMDSTGTTFFPAGDVNVQAGNLLVNGEGTVKVLEITGGADLSENFAVTKNDGEADLEPGTIVSIDPENAGALTMSNGAYDTKVAGIISGAGGLGVGMRMGQAGTIAHGDHPVALTGRVYAKADISNGVINPGDLLTTSERPGHAMKVTDYVKAQGAIIGKAMTPVDPETGLVLVLVSLQ